MSDTGVSVTYKFDASGNRIERDATVGGVSSVEKFVVDGWDTTKPRAVGTENFDTILDLDGVGNVTNRRMFGSGFDDMVGRQDAAGSVKWYATDRLGSVRQVFDNAGNVSGTTDYDAFGGFLGGVSVDRYAFTGREVDAPLGLQYSRGRMYDSATGRWMGEDPIRTAAGDANLYRYVGNAATNARDPSGNWLITETRADADAWIKELGDNGVSAQVVSVDGGKRFYIHIPENQAENLWKFVQTREGDGQAAVRMFNRMMWSEFGRETHIQGNTTGRFATFGGLTMLTQEQHIEILQWRARQQGHTFTSSQDEANYWDAAFTGLAEGFVNLKDVAIEMIQEAYELGGEIIKDPAGFAIQMGEAIYMLATDSEVRKQMVGKMLEEFEANPSKALLKMGLGILCGGASNKLMGAVKTLLKARAAKLLKFLKGKVTGEVADKIKELAEMAGKTTDPKDLQKIHAALDEIEKTGKIPLDVISNKTCFVAGTPLLTPDGHKTVEEFRPGDFVLSRSEHDPEGTVEPKVVEAVFTRVSPTCKLYVDGRVICTTYEHPFWVEGRGWLLASELEAGMQFRSHTNELISLAGIERSGSVETVYNLQIAEYHTYFVGASDWGFSVWAHNAEYSIRVGSNGKFEIVNSKGELIGDALEKLEDAELLAKKFNDDLAKAAAECATKVPKRFSSPKHHKNSISPEPSNAQQLFEKSIVDEKGVRWAKDADGVIHRFSERV